MATAAPCRAKDGVGFLYQPLLQSGTTTLMMSTISGTAEPLCPKCQTDFVKRSRRAGLIEYVMSTFSIYPFRCQLCSDRFYVKRRGAKYKRRFDDRRDYDRLPVDLPATFSSETFHGQGSVREISVAGCSLSTETQLEMGNILHIELRLPHQPDPVVIEIAILRSVQYNYARLEFLEFKIGDKDRLQHFVAELISGNSLVKA